jgi:hypothetical protein
MGTKIHLHRKKKFSDGQHSKGDFSSQQFIIYFIRNYNRDLCFLAEKIDKC